MARQSDRRTARAHHRDHQGAPEMNAGTDVDLWAWGAALKEGDLVALYDGQGQLIGRKRITKAEKRFVYIDNLKFRREGGQEARYERFWSRSIGPVTDKVLEEIERGQIVFHLSHLNWRGYPTDVLRRVNEIIEETKKP